MVNNIQDMDSLNLDMVNHSQGMDSLNQECHIQVIHPNQGMGNLNLDMVNLNQAMGSLNQAMVSLNQAMVSLNQDMVSSLSQPTDNKQVVKSNAIAMLVTLCSGAIVSHNPT